ncbi:MAG: aminopeptidase P family protein [Chlamydiia bacterium]|nr:aminopeptidase P family protein [Chlamydiia bacterium]
MYLKRIKQLQKLMKGIRFLIEDPVDLLYLTGIELSSGQMIVTRQGATLYVDGRYTESAKNQSPIPVKPRGQQIPPAATVLGFDENKTTYGRYLQLKKQCKVKAMPSLVNELRYIKDAQEIQAMKKSAKLLWKGYEWLCKELRVGVTEIEMAHKFEAFVKQNGAERLSFDPIIAFGANTSKPHYHSGKAKLKNGDLVLMDMGVVVNGYCSDMTRTFFYGKQNQKLERLLETTKAAQLAALSCVKPGVLLSTLDQAARYVMKKEGLEKQFLHSLGHGIGLEVHEAPRIASTGVDSSRSLEEGMVITIEPGLYVPGLGGARIEDTIVVTNKGYENFYPETDK